MPRRLNRQYTNIKTSDARFFIGREIERTPYYGLKTLFVVGVQCPNEITKLAHEHDCKHIFFGANYSFDPKGTTEETLWLNMLAEIANQQWPMTIDTTLKHQHLLAELVKLDNFCMQIRLPIANVEQIKNCYLKVDDIGFRSTNSGIWTINVKEITTEKNYTSWLEYGEDTAIL